MVLLVPSNLCGRTDPTQYLGIRAYQVGGTVPPAAPCPRAAEKPG